MLGTFPVALYPFPTLMGSVAHAIKLVKTSLAINAVLALIKIYAGIHGHAQALVADGLESAADVVSSLIVLWGISLAARPADQDHPYGHGKYDSLASVAVAGMLLAAAAWIGVESIHRMVTPHPAPHAYTIAVLLGVIVVKGVLHYRLSAAGKSVESSSLNGEVIHQHADILTSAAALIGILIAVIGGPAYTNADSWAALVACVVIIYNAARLVRPALDEIVVDGAKIHLEQMSHDQWWMGIEAGGKYFHLNFGLIDGRLTVHLSDQGEGEDGASPSASEGRSGPHCW